MTEFLQLGSDQKNYTVGSRVGHVTQCPIAGDAKATGTACMLGHNALLQTAMSYMKEIRRYGITPVLTVVDYISKWRNMSAKLTF